ncbi:MAG: SDR family oxidoreductase [Myxococcales bacterium]|nr:SDR family oxidoreductase [Myxococcales bacterium]MCB9526479.1 SDR family oxidoreductase [Myxococcales bacterium]
MSDQPAPQVLITGFPRLLARGLAQRILNTATRAQVVLLVPPGHFEAAQAFADGLPDDLAHRLTLLEGDPDGVDLGLPGPRVARLLDHTTHIIHAALRQQGADVKAANARRFATVLDLAREMPRLQRLGVFSTAFVSGDRAGTIQEEDLDEGQALRSAFEASQLHVERLARAEMARLPITVLRPSAMIGHSRTGNATGLTEGPNYLVRLMVTLPAEVPVLLPGTGGVPFNIVPVDYVVHATWALLEAPEAVGRTFHLTDPNPVSARKAFELLSDLAARPAPFAGDLAATWARRALRWTKLDRLAPAQAALLDDLSRHVIYNCSGTLELLADTGIECPPFEAYADTLVSWLAALERADRGANDEDAD